MDLIKPDVRRDVENKQYKHLNKKPTRSFEVGQEVLARDYRQDKWNTGTVTSRDGPLMYSVDMGGDVWRRHVDQILDAQVHNSVSPGMDLPKQEMDNSNHSAPPTAAPPQAVSSSADTTPEMAVQPSSSSSEEPVRRYPERQRKPTVKLNL